MKQFYKVKNITVYLAKHIGLCVIILCFLLFNGCSTREVPQEAGSEIKTADTEEDLARQPETKKKKVLTEKKETIDKEEESKQMKSKETYTGGIKKFSQAGALHVEGAQLTDSTGETIQLRGTSTHGLAWFPQYVNQEFFKELSSKWNVNVVRLAMYTAENGGYCTDGNKEALKQLVKDGVRYATEADLYVIVDWHILSDGNPHTHKEEAKKFFEEISSEYATYENVIYEICNEPNGDVSWGDVKAYAEEIIPIIRANDEDAVIIVGTPNWSQDVDKAAADPITGYNNIMYSLHFYAATHTDWLRDRMVKVIDAGLPVFVSEFGTCDASGNGGIDYAQSDAWIQKMDEYQVSYVTWNLSNKGETSAIFRSGCDKASGFAEGDFSENGKWILDMLKSAHGNGNQGKEVKADINANVDEETNPEIKADNQPEILQKEDLTGSSGELQYTALISNSWEAEGKYFYQYNLTLKNTSAKEVNDWKIVLNFNEGIELSDGWNGNYIVKDNILEITSKDYNANIASQGEVLDVGFIISAGEDTILLCN